MAMVCIAVSAEDGMVAFPDSQGSFELNAMPPIIINTHHSIHVDRTRIDETAVRSRSWSRPCPR